VNGSGNAFPAVLTASAQSKKLCQTFKLSALNFILNRNGSFYSLLKEHCEKKTHVLGSDERFCLNVDWGFFASFWLLYSGLSM